MLSPFMNSLGDRNPQLLRELKSRLRGRGIVTAATLSVIAQLLLLAFFRSTVESSPWEFCSVVAEGSSRWDACRENGQVVWELIDWSLWWQAILVTMNWAFPIILTGIGMYMLLSDLQKEEQRGTLNFLRLSPRSSSSIFLGKLLGIPVLVYLGIGLALPLHLFAAFSAKAPLGFMASYYLLLGLDALLFFSLAIVIGLLASRSAKEQGNAFFSGGVTLALPLLTSVFLVPYHLMARQFTVWHGFPEFMFSRNWGLGIADESAGQWFGLSFAEQPLATHGVQLLFLAVAIFWLWKILQRAYRQPNATPLSKPMSYGMVVSGLVMLLGLCSPAGQVSEEDIFMIIGLFFVILAIWPGSLLLMATLLPSRQTLLDWGHRRRMQPPEQRSSLVQELLLGERSPGVVAVIVNLLLMVLISLGWMTQFLEKTSEVTQATSGAPFLGGLVLTLLAIAIYAALAQLMLFLKTPKRSTWAVGAVVLAMLLPLISGGILSIGNNGSAIAQILLLLSPVPWAAWGSSSPVESGLIASAVLFECFVLAELLWKLSEGLHNETPLVKGS